MFTHPSRGQFGLVKNPLTLTAMALAVLVAALSGNASAQTQTTSNTGEAVAAMVASAKAEPAMTDPAANSAVSPGKARKAKPQGAGSDNHGYIFLRGYVFQVHRSNGNPALINSDAGGMISSVDNFNYGAEGAFKVEAGWNATNNFGFRASYFYTTQSAQENRTATAAAPFIVSPRPLNVTFTGAADAGTTAAFRERFRMHVIDIEGTYKWHDPNWSVLLSGGVRIAPTRQVYTAQDTFAGGIENVIYTQKRTGWGPTIALDLRHRIGGSNWWWTGAARAAALFGDLKETANFTVGTFTSPVARTASRSNGVFEGEVGIEWAHNFGSGNQFFINGSFITHHWANIVNVMPVSPVGGSATASLDSPTAPTTRKGSITFIGGAFSIGFRF